MPFTPLHVGPALLVALIAYPLLDVPTLLVASVVLDIEPLIIILLGLPQPLHSQYHSLTLGLLVALAVALAMRLLRPYTEPIMVSLKLSQGSDIKTFIASAYLGVLMHVVMEAFIYSDLTLLYPLQVNPLLGILSPSTVSNIGLASYPVAIALYILRITLTSWMEGRKNAESNPVFPELDEETGPINEDVIERIDSATPQETLAEPSHELTTITESNNGLVDKPFNQTAEKTGLVEEPGIEENNVEPDVFLGAESAPRQWGIVGHAGEELVAVDLNEPHIVFVCGKQGSGKGYTIGVISEMLLSKTIQGISQVAKPATLIVFHKPREDMRSEFWSIVEKNTNESECEALRNKYDVKPRRIITEQSFRIFVDPYVYVNERSKFMDEYRAKVYPIGIKPNRLTAEDWPYVLSLGKKSGSMYVKKVFQIIKKTQYEEGFGLGTIRREVEASDLNPNQKGFALMRLETLEDYLEGSDFIGDLTLGGVNVFDLRKIMMEPDDIFSVMMLVISSLINNERTEREQFVFVINEAHDYLRKGLSKDFTDYINYLIRKKRHAGTWLMLDTHFPEDVDPKVIKGSDIKIFHKSDVVTSSLLRQVVEGTPTPPHMLNTGEAVIRADKSNMGPDKVLVINVRPRLTLHGAATKTAV